jgi:hypothetical protein
MGDRQIKRSASVASTSMAHMFRSQIDSKKEEV